MSSRLQHAESEKKKKKKSPALVQKRDNEKHGVKTKNESVVMKRLAPNQKNSFASVVRQENSMRTKNVIVEKEKERSPTTTTNTMSVSDLKSYISSSNARLAAVDIEPSHIIGINLNLLSIAQLEILEKFHMNQLSKIMEQRVLKTQDLEKSKLEEFQKLQEQIQQLCSFTEPTESII